MHQIRFRLGLCPRPLAGFEGVLLLREGEGMGEKGRGKGKKRKKGGRKGREKEGEGGEGREGEGCVMAFFWGGDGHPWYRHKHNIVVNNPLILS